MPLRCLACLAWVFLLTSAAGAQTPPRLAVKDLQALKSSANDPGGDFFHGTPEKLGALLDAMAADSSLLSPMHLLMAANTAMRLGRVADAAFFLYAGQIRAAFDFDRYDISSRPDGNNAATYLAFLKQTTGESVNPAIQREPTLFASVIDRVERWEVVPAADAFYPEFEAAKGFKMPRQEWEAHGRSIKHDFLEKFGRRYATLLNTPEFFAAHMIVENANPLEKDPAAAARVQAAVEQMAAIEARLFPPQRNEPQGRGAAGGRPAAASEPANEPDAARPNENAADAVPLRVGGNVPAPKKLTHVEPIFAKGQRGSIIIELTIDREGRVARFNVLAGDFELFSAAETAIRQWVFEPVVVGGKRVSVLQTVSFTAR